MISGCVVLDLSGAPESVCDTVDRRVLQALERCPDGARVVVDVGARQFVTYDIAHWLHSHDHRLLIEIRGTDPQAIGRFIAAARTGGLDEVVA